MSEAKVLQALNVIRDDYNQGRRPAPAFTQVTSDQRGRLDDQAWDGIKNDLEDAGIDAESISGSHALIRHWLDYVKFPLPPPS